MLLSKTKLQTVRYRPYGVHVCSLGNCHLSVCQHSCLRAEHRTSVTQVQLTLAQNLPSVWQGTTFRLDVESCQSAAALDEAPEFAAEALKAIITGTQSVAKGRQGPDAANDIQV